MQRPQTGLTLLGPTGSPKNCTSWAEYETPGSSSTANMCNGGWYKGEYYNECKSKADCVAATIRAKSMTSDRRSLPVHTNEPKPFGDRGNGSQLLGRTPNLADHLKGWGAWGTAPTTIPKADGPPRPGAVLPTPFQVPAPLPYPVQPPVEWPVAMQTPYAAPMPSHSGGVSPTFLPHEEESVLGRLFKNVAQGWIASTGWHVYDYSRTVDLFGRRK